MHKKKMSRQSSHKSADLIIENFKELIDEKDTRVDIFHQSRPHASKFRL